KLTTYRRMAQDALDHVDKQQGKVPSQPTKMLPLIGAIGWQEAIAMVQAAAKTLDFGPETVERLGKYGAEAKTMLTLIEQNPALRVRIVSDLPYIMAEVVFPCRYEMAINLDDVLTRRLHINFEDRARGREAAPAVAQVMARELNWDTAEIERQVNRYS